MDKTEREGRSRPAAALFFLLSIALAAFPSPGKASGTPAADLVVLAADSKAPPKAQGVQRTQGPQGMRPAPGRSSLSEEGTASSEKWTARGLAVRYHGDSPMQAKEWTAALGGEAQCVRESLRFVADAGAAGWWAVHVACLSPDGSLAGTARTDGDRRDLDGKEFLGNLIVSGSFLSAAAILGPAGPFGTEPGAAGEPGPHKGRIAAAEQSSARSASGWIEEWESPDAVSCAKEAAIRAMSAAGVGARAIRASCAAPSGLQSGWIFSDGWRIEDVARKSESSGTMTEPWRDAAARLSSGSHPLSIGDAPPAPEAEPFWPAAIAAALRVGSRVGIPAVVLLFLRGVYGFGKSQGRRETIAAGILEAVQSAGAGKAMETTASGGNRAPADS